jgi:hypothetical protein
MVESTEQEMARLRQRVARLERQRRSPASVIALLALVVALSGGSAWAAATIGTAQIKNGAVTTAKLADGAVKTGRVSNGAITSAKVASGAVTAGKIANNAVTSAKIANGQVVGPDLGSIIVREITSFLQASSEGGIPVSCQPGERLISGGHYTLGSDVYNLQSYPSDASTWFAFFRNTSGEQRPITAYALCLQAP